MRERARHGTYSYHFEGADFSGNAAPSVSFNASFDIDAPTATPGFADGATFSTYRPTPGWGVADNLSGIASASLQIDGSPANAAFDGQSLSLAPTADVALGEHQLTLTLIDSAGNRSTSIRGFKVADTTPPITSIVAPAARGDNTPILDALAIDDKSGVDPSTWSVSVNGQPIPASSASGHLQVDLGFLVNGSHVVVVHVSDRSGNVATTTLHYNAQSADGVPTLPGLTGVYILDAPSVIEKGVSVRIRAAAAKNGRPLAGLRAEIHQGASTIAGKPVSADGTVDVQVTVTSGDPMTLTVDGSGLPDATIDFTLHTSAIGGGAAVAGAAASPTKTQVPAIAVAKVLDGDTIRLEDGRIVRLLQIDAPDASGPAECFGGRATKILRHLLRPGTRITMAPDKHLPHANAHGQILRYVFVGKQQINRTLVQRGAATPYFPGAKRGRYGTALLADARKARAAHAGLWGACPATPLAPNANAKTGPA